MSLSLLLLLLRGVKVCAKHYPRHWGHSMGQNRKQTKAPEADIRMRRQTINKPINGYTRCVRW